MYKCNTCINTIQKKHLKTFAYNSFWHTSFRKKLLTTSLNLSFQFHQTPLAPHLYFQQFHSLNSSEYSFIFLIYHFVQFYPLYSFIDKIYLCNSTIFPHNSSPCCVRHKNCAYFWAELKRVWLYTQMAFTYLIS